jgi:hypothetical protein
MEVQVTRGTGKGIADVTRQVSEMLKTEGHATQRFLTAERDDAGRIVWYLKTQEGEKLGSYMVRNPAVDDEFDRMVLVGTLAKYFQSRLDAKGIFGSPDHKDVA